MKKILSIAFVVVLLGGGCFGKLTPPPSAPPLAPRGGSEEAAPLPLDPYLMPAVKFGEEFMLSLNEARVFEDGLTIELMDIQDSRCKPDVVCIWQGELAYLIGLNLMGSVPPKDWQNQIRLSTEMNKTVEANGYVFALVEGNETSLKLTVTKK